MIMDSLCKLFRILLFQNISFYFSATRRDATATSGLLKGVAIGGIFVPLILGYLMRHVGPNILSLGLAVLSVGLSVTYAVIHMYLSTEAEAVIVRGRKRLRSASSGARSFSGQNSMSVHNEARVRLRSLSYNSAEYGSSDITV